MSRYSGPRGHGARALDKKHKRIEAELRDAITLPDRRASFRRQRARVQARLAELAREAEPR